MSESTSLFALACYGTPPPECTLCSGCGLNRDTVDDQFFAGADRGPTADALRRAWLANPAELRKVFEEMDVCEGRPVHHSEEGGHTKLYQQTHVYPRVYTWACTVYAAALTLLEETGALSANTDVLDQIATLDPHAILSKLDEKSYIEALDGLRLRMPNRRAKMFDPAVNFEKAYGWSLTPEDFMIGCTMRVRVYEYAVQHALVGHAMFLDYGEPVYMPADGPTPPLDYCEAEIWECRHDPEQLLSWLNWMPPCSYVSHWLRAAVDEAACISPEYAEELRNHPRVKVDLKGTITHLVVDAITTRPQMTLTVIKGTAQTAYKGLAEPLASFEEQWSEAMGLLLEARMAKSASMAESASDRKSATSTLALICEGIDRAALERLTPRIAAACMRSSDTTNYQCLLNCMLACRRLGIDVSKIPDQMQAEYAKYPAHGPEYDYRPNQIWMMRSMVNF